MAYYLKTKDEKINDMEQTENVKRSALYEEIYKIVKQIPMKSVEHDAMDAPSASYLIEQLFKKWQQHGVSGKRTDLRSIVESIIVPQGYKIVHIGHTAEVSASQFLYKKQVEQLITELSEAACASGWEDTVAARVALPEECQSKIDGECHLPIGTCKQCDFLKK